MTNPYNTPSPFAMRETSRTSVTPYAAGAWVDTYVQGTHEPENRYRARSQAVRSAPRVSGRPNQAALRRASSTSHARHASLADCVRNSQVRSAWLGTRAKAWEKCGIQRP